MQRIVLILLLSVSFASMQGQGRSDFFYYDSLTYKLYTDSRWSELTDSGMEALKLGHDFYYMRMRIGISYYERNKYFAALKHFRKALEFNAGDPVATEYIYYCYLLSGNYWIANAVTKDFSQALRKKTGTVTGKSNRISVDFVYNSSDSESTIEEYLTLNSPVSPGSHIFPKNYFNMGITLAHTTAPGRGIVHSLSYLRRVNSLSVSDGANSYNDYEQVVNQVHYFFSPLFTSKSGFTFAPTAYYLNTRYPLIEFGTNGMNPFAYTLTVTENNIGGGGYLSSTLGSVEIKGSGYYSHMGYRNHFQSGLEITLYPLGNGNLYLGAEYNYKNSKSQDGIDNGAVIKGRAGFSISRKLFFDFTGLYGDIENYIENNGQIVYNGINDVSSILKADISIPFGESGVILFLGSRFTKETSAYLPTDYLYSTVSERSINSFSFIGGLSWTY